MYKALLFDFFGVFCPDLTFEWFKKTVPNYYDLIDGLQAICDRSDRGELSRESFHGEVSKLTGIPVSEVKIGISSQMVLNKSLINYVREIKPNYKVALISNTSSEWVDRILNEYKLNGILDEVVVSAKVGMTKPDKPIFDYAINKLRVRNSECVFIDDRQLNVDKAKSYGIESLLFVNTDKLINDLSMLGIQS